MKENKKESKYYHTALLMDEALLQLLEKKDFLFITVKEVCQRAGVNRSTFYLHYENLYDLLEETIKLLNNRFVSSFPKELLVNLKGRVLTSKEFLIPYLNFIKENKKVYKTIHQRPDIFEVNKVFSKMYQNIFDPALESFKVREKEKKYVFEFYTKGCLGIIQKWVEDDCKDEIDLIVNIISKHTMADETNNK